VARHEDLMQKQSEYQLADPLNLLKIKILEKNLRPVPWRQEAL
jgi:hypothetical protein